MQLTASLLLLALLLFSWRMVRIRWQMVGGLLHEMSLLMLLALFFSAFSAGKRTIGGLLDDGVKSMVRYYLNNFQVREGAAP